MVTFDQQVLSRDGETWPLPPFAAGETHLVSAEAHFPEGVSARADISFTGRPGSRVTTELTAVPIVVWSTGDPGTDAWGSAVDVGSPSRLERACEHLLESLYRQWIVWVEGRYLPDQITLDESVEGIRIAG